LIIDEGKVEINANCVGAVNYFRAIFYDMLYFENSSKYVDDKDGTIYTVEDGCLTNWTRILCYDREAGS
jgi:hypothetical protein